MPIRKSERGKYPAGWHAISAGIKTRAGNRCEGSPQYPDCRAVNGEPHPVTGSRVVLTVGHLNHEPSDCRPENLKAWCQRCHLTYDAAHHAANARQTRREKLRNGELAYELPDEAIDTSDIPPVPDAFFKDAVFTRPGEVLKNPEQKAASSTDGIKHGRE
jgi:hypothetical protein